MERRGRIPVAKFRTQEGKTRSRSRVRDPDYNDQDPETDLFTLLEDNIALREENKALKVEIAEHKRMQLDLLDEKVKMQDDLDLVQKQHSNLQSEMKELTIRFAKVNNERSALEKSSKASSDKIASLTRQLENAQRINKQASAAANDDSVELKVKLLKVLPTITTGEMESLADVETPGVSDLVERLVNEFLTLKTSLNSVELQLYEANEKISELIENQHHVEEENETLRFENTNLTKVAKLLTDNMKESVETSKKMETALIKLKQRNDELVAKSKDATDGTGPASSPTIQKANEEFEQIKNEVEGQNREHNERIVEMKSLMEAAIQTNTNDELKTLQLKLEILEEELKKAVARAELAEHELADYQKREKEKQQQVGAPEPPPPPPPLPPPPPPPLPGNLIFKRPSPSASSSSSSEQLPSDGKSFSATIALHNLHRGDRGLVKQQVHSEATTGLDALVQELKSGRVTLRRNRRKTNERTNEALQEMFTAIEMSQRRNRDSKICINMHNVP